MRVRILIGDVLVRLREIPDETYDEIVTSPPYWGLRDYGVPGQLGLEPTLGEHLEAMVAVFRELRRVLKKTGTVWLNYGDCYASQPNGRSAADTKLLSNDDRTFRDKPFSTVGPIYPPETSQPFPNVKRRGGGNNTSPGLKPKDLCMVPNRLAIALQEDGWWVRGEIVWGKSNPMPESIDDRPATAHEKVFLLTKSGSPTIWRARDSMEWNLKPDLTERLPKPTEEDPDATVNRWRAFDYYYDAEAVRMNRSGDEDANGFRGGSHTDHKPGGRIAKGNYRVPTGWADNEGSHGTVNVKGRSRSKRQDEIAAAAGEASSGRRMAGFNERWDDQGGSRRNSFARGGKLATDEHGQKPQFREDRDPVSYVGDGRNLRNYEPAPLEVWRIATKPFRDAHFATFPPDLAERCIKAGCPVGGLVLDPFGGAGTTGLVAEHLQRDCDMIELNPEYARLAVDRLRRDFGLLGSVEIVE